jgi:molybdopterin-containing oxidoreductase family iron-sulfur binding subunit
MSSGSSVIPGVTEPDPALQHAKRLGMVVDLDRCIGCWTCAVACKQENNVPEGLYYLRILTVGGDGIDKPAGTFPDLSLAYQSTNCFHCDNPPCVKACPVAATYKRPDGIVAVDYDRCIGCRYCVAACPYGARYADFGEDYEVLPAAGQVVSPEYKQFRARVPGASPIGNVRKCTFCLHLQDENGEYDRDAGR